MIFSKINSTIIIIQIITIAILGFVGYANSLRGDFVYDDLILVKDNPYIKTFYRIPDVLTKDIGAGALSKFNFYRPVQMISYMFDYTFWKLDVIGYHLTNVLLHILVALVIYWLINVLYGKWLLSFFTSILFVIHPVHTEAVAYISGRADLLSALFMLLSIIFYIKQASFKSITLYILIFLSYVLALLSKEYSLITPMLLIVYSYVFRKKLLFREFLTILSITFIYFMFRIEVLKFSSSHTMPSIILFQRMPGFFVSIIEYLRLLLLPFNLHMEYGNRLFSFGDFKTIAGVTALFMLLIYAFKKKGRDNLMSFSIFWFFMALLPVSNLYPINAYMAEHWLYVPSIGFFLIFANIFILLLKKAKKFQFIFISLLASILFFYSYLTIRQNNYWRDPLVFYKTTLQYVPKNEKIYTNLGAIYFSVGKIRESVVAFQKLIEINPNNAGAYNNLGNLYDETGDREKAISMFKKAIRLAPDYIHTYYNLAKIYLDTANFQEAVVLYKKVIAINPNAAEAYYNLGKIYSAMGDKENAFLMFKKAIEADPNYLQAYIMLGQLYKFFGGEEEVISLYKKAIAKKLEYFEAYYNIGNLYSAIGQDRDAIALYKRAIEIKPNSAQAYAGLGSSCCAIGKNKMAIIFLKKALQLNPNLGVAQNNLAAAYYYEKKYDLAIKHYDKAIELGYEVNPKFSELLKPYRQK